MKKENWTPGKNGGTVITDCDDGFENTTGHKDPTREYYGGTLIAESIWREKDVLLIAAAPDLLGMLNSLVLSITAHPDYVSGEEGDEWHDLVSLADDVIKKATE